MRLVMAALPKIAGILLLAMTLPATAEESTARSGPYVGGAGGIQILTPHTVDEFSDALGVDASAEFGIGAQLFAGYRLHPRIAAQVRWEWLGDIDVRERSLDAFTLEGWTLTADAKGYLATGFAQPFLLVGAGVMHAETSGRSAAAVPIDGTDFAARFGAGLEVYITDHVVGLVDATYVLPTGSVADLDYISIGFGIAYRF